MNFYVSIVAEFVLQVHRDSHVLEFVEISLNDFYKFVLKVVGDVAKDMLQCVPTDEQYVLCTVKRIERI